MYVYLHTLNVPLCLILRMLPKNPSGVETGIVDFIRTWLTLWWCLLV